MSMSKWAAAAAAAIGFLSVTTLAFASDADVYGPDITLSEAKQVAAGAIKECAANKWLMAIAVVDTHGALVYYEKADNTEVASAQIALDKATSAAVYKRPTRDFFDVTAKMGPFMLNMDHVIAAPGGIPVMKDGKIIGAISASGGTGMQDEQCAKAGLAGF